MTKPPMAYFGGKTRLADRIADLLPPHLHYVEPFGGSLAVLLAKPPSRHETVNDIDGDLVAFWRVLRDRPADLIRACALTPHSRIEHDLAYDLDTAPDDVERARRVWTQIVQGRAGVRSKTGWRQYINPTGSRTSMPGYLDAYVERMASCAERLHNVSLEAGDALDLITLYGEAADVLIYADPPYVGQTRARNQGRYLHEMKDDASHRSLADALRSCAASVVLSGYPGDLYDDLYDGWDRIEIAAFTGQGARRRATTEVLWSNRDISQPRLFEEASE